MGLAARCAFGVVAAIRLIAVFFLEPAKQSRAPPALLFAHRRAGIGLAFGFAAVAILAKVMATRGQAEQDNGADEPRARRGQADHSASFPDNDRDGQNSLIETNLTIGIGRGETRNVRIVWKEAKMHGNPGEQVVPCRSNRSGKIGNPGHSVFSAIR
jgi:hypothetical protein